MNLSDFIGPAAAGFLGFVGGYVALDKRQAVSEARMDERLKGLLAMLVELKAEHMRSAADQGTRLGEMKGLVGTLMDWRTEMKATERERRRADTRGVPIPTDET